MGSSAQDLDPPTFVLTSRFPIRAATRLTLTTKARRNPAPAFDDFSSNIGRNVARSELRSGDFDPSRARRVIRTPLGFWHLSSRSHLAVRGGFPETSADEIAKSARKPVILTYSGRSPAHALLVRLAFLDLVVQSVHRRVVGVLRSCSTRLVGGSDVWPRPKQSPLRSTHRAAATLRWSSGPSRKPLNWRFCGVHLAFHSQTRLVHHPTVPNGSFSRPAQESP